VLKAAPKRCASCDGKGSAGPRKCEPCKGNGNVLVYPPFIKCPHCGGSGKRQNRDWTLSQYCMACNGRGWALSFVIDPGASEQRGEEDDGGRAAS